MNLFLTVYFCLRHRKHMSLTFLSGDEDTKLQLKSALQRRGRLGVEFYFAYDFVIVMANLRSTFITGQVPGLH